MRLAFLSLLLLCASVQAGVLITVLPRSSPPPPGDFQFSASSYTADDTDGTLDIPVQRVNGSYGTATVDYAVGAGDCNDTDSDTLTWTNGDTDDQNITVTINDCGGDTFDTTLSNPSAGSSITGTNPVTATVSDAGGSTFAACIADPGTYQTNSAWFNSCETGCGVGATAGARTADLNADYLLCDDFEDGAWAAVNANGYFQGTQASDWASCAGSEAEDYQGCSEGDNDGWYMQENNSNWGSGESQSTALVVDLGASGFGSSTHAAKSVCSGGSGCSPDGHGQHNFLNDQCVSEFYLRYYQKIPTGYYIGQEKSWVSVNNENALTSGIWSTFVFTFSTGTGDVDGYTVYEIGGASRDFNYTFTRDHWHYVELHWKEGSIGGSDGTFEVWADDCGTDGSDCTGTPTKRLTWTTAKTRPDSGHACSLWFENWSGTGAGLGDNGTRYFSNVVVSSSPIGFCEECVQ